MTVSSIVHNTAQILILVKDDATGMKSTIITKERGKIYEDMNQLLSL